MSGAGVAYFLPVPKKIFEGQAGFHRFSLLLSGVLRCCRDEEKVPRFLKSEHASGAVVQGVRVSFRAVCVHR